MTGTLKASQRRARLDVPLPLKLEAQVLDLCQSVTCSHLHKVDRTVEVVHLPRQVNRALLAIARR